MALTHFIPGPFFTPLPTSKGLPVDVNVICYHKNTQLLSTTTTFICPIKSESLTASQACPRETKQRQDLSMFLTPTEMNQLKYIVIYCTIIAESIFNIKLSWLVNFNCVCVTLVSFTV